MVTLATDHRPIRKGALVAGAALLAMAILAGLATSGVVNTLVVEGDAARTAQNISGSAGLFRLGVAGLALVAILDVIVAWGLLTFLKPADPALATLTAWLRAAYAAVFMVAIGQLAGVLPLVGDAAYAQAYSADQLHAEVMVKISAFQDIWNAGFTFFGLHLLLLGYLTYRSGYVPKLLGILLAIAGLGYLVDAFGTLLVPDYALNAAVFTFGGEILLMLWLLVKGRSLAPNSHTPTRDAMSNVDPDHAQETTAPGAGHQVGGTGSNQ